MLSISQESNDRKLSFPPPTLNIGIEYLKKKSISYRQVINKNPAVITTQDFLLCIAEISSALKIVELKVRKSQRELVVFSIPPKSKHFFS